MKKTQVHITILLLLLISISLLKGPMVYLNYEINKDFIANNLCVDRNVEGSTCEGQCHLKEQLKKVDGNTENEVPSMITVKFTEEYFCASAINNKSIDYFIRDQKVNSGLTSFYSFHFLAEIFHPPIV